jgi:hypothetical protein
LFRLKTFCECWEGRYSGESGRGEESVGHRFHIDETESSKLTDWRTSHRCLGEALNDCASHRFEDVLGEASIAL